MWYQEFGAIATTPGVRAGATAAAVPPARLAAVKTAAAITLIRFLLMRVSLIRARALGITLSTSRA